MRRASHNICPPGPYSGPNSAKKGWLLMIRLGNWAVQGDKGRSMRMRRSTRILRHAAADFVTGLLIFFAVYGLAFVDSRRAWPASFDAGVVLAHHLPNAAGAPIGATGEPLSRKAINGGGADNWTKDVPLRRDTRFNSSSSPSISSKSTGTKVAQLSKPRPVHAPLGAAADNRLGALAAMALFFAAMCAVTLGFWRHVRRAYASPRRN